MSQPCWNRWRVELVIYQWFKIISARKCHVIFMDSIPNAVMLRKVGLTIKYLRIFSSVKCKILLDIWSFCFWSSKLFKMKSIKQKAFPVLPPFNSSDWKPPFFFCKELCIGVYCIRDGWKEKKQFTVVLKIIHTRKNMCSSNIFSCTCLTLVLSLKIGSWKAS